MTHRLLTLALTLLVCSATSHAGLAQYLPDERITEAAPDSFLVSFETTRGPFDVMVYRDWSPLAADRLYHLVRLHYYDENMIFRVVPGFVVQFGIHEREEVTSAWYDRGVPDEPVQASNLRGRVSFARGGPETRTSQIFINLVDNVRLDTIDAGGITGYPPVGEVVRGMETVDAFFGEYGNAPAARQDSIRAQGRAYLDREFPGLDQILSARIIEEYR
jgi:peptidyl-prolyl cis-trans isomerase A (cyclophilin A)